MRVYQCVCVRSCRRRNFVCMWCSREGVVRNGERWWGWGFWQQKKKNAAESFLRLNDNEAYRNKVCIIYIYIYSTIYTISTLPCQGYPLWISISYDYRHSWALQLRCMQMPNYQRRRRIYRFTCDNGVSIKYILFYNAKASPFVLRQVILSKTLQLHVALVAHLNFTS
jgi:hypothetical protein